MPAVRRSGPPCSHASSPMARTTPSAASVAASARVAREHDGELVAAEPVGLADPAQLARHVREHTVAGRMPVAVVDLLEVVEVEETDRERLPGRRRLLELDLQLLLEVPVVAEAGERIGQGEPHRPQRVERRALVQRDGDERTDEHECQRRRLCPEDDEREADGEHDRERRGSRERRRPQQRQERLSRPARQHRGDQEHVDEIEGRCSGEHLEEQGPRRGPFDGGTGLIACSGSRGREREDGAVVNRA